VFKDHFSGARGYQLYRPGYPVELFEFLARVAPRTDVVWDCGTGSGQAALGLTSLFSTVLATDSSLRQIIRGSGEGDVRFLVSSAECTSLASGSVDLITVAQALHWFDFDAFYAEVKRVAKPGGVLAAWAYPLLSAGPGVDGVLAGFVGETVGDFWPLERRYVDGHYENLPFPFTRLETPRFFSTAKWSLGDLVGYVGTWSAVNRYRETTGHDPLPRLADKLTAVWGGAHRRRVTWPLPLLLGRVESRATGH
jgi:SAM-dependent methyltransferase